jgi:DNA-binding NarL/FixJ family response regulator
MMLLNQGFAALISGDVREAEQRLAEGLQIARQLDDRVAQCHLLGALARCAAGSRELRLAAQLFGAMENLRAEAGATNNAGMAPALAQAQASVTQALGLSRFSNRQIGGHLFISERTVESHVRSIMNKLGFNSRAQIAGWMATPDR